MEAGSESGISWFREYAGFPNEPFSVQDLDRPAADPDEALIAQGLELLVDAFPRRTDHGSQIFLCDLHSDPDVPPLTDAEGVSEVEDFLRQAGGDIEEVHIREEHVRFADFARKDRQDFLDDIKAVAHEGQEIFPMQTEGNRLLQGQNRGGAGLAVEEGEFAQKVSRAAYGQDQLLPGRGRDRDFHPAAFDEVEGATLVAHVEERLAGGVPPPDKAFFEGFEFGRPEAGEQRDLVPQFFQRNAP